MAATTYSTLIAQIKDNAENDGTEFTDAIPSFISRTSERLLKEVDPLGLNRYVESTFIVGDPFLSKPANTRIVRDLNYVTAEGNRIQLTQMTNEYLNDYWPNRTSVGSPRYYSNFGYNRVLVAPAPSSTSTVEMSYVVEPSTLVTTTNETNYFTDYCANALFFGSMVEACYYMKNPSAAAYWEQQYGREVAALNNEARRDRRDDNEIPANPAGGEDNLMKGSE